MSRFESSEKVSVAWYKDKKQIKESKNYKITSDTTSTTLKIIESSSEFSGTYSVEVVNSTGKEESSATLTVKGLSRIQKRSRAS